jgi:hypothetical protein
VRGLDDNKMTYLITSPHKILRLFVGPFLPRPFLREMYQFVEKLFLTLFAMWRPARVSVPNSRCSSVPVKAERP